MVTASDARGAGEGAAQAAAEAEVSGPKPELGEASDGASSQSSDVREHVETVELNSLNVLHTRAAAVLVVLMHEHLHRRNVQTTVLWQS